MTAATETPNPLHAVPDEDLLEEIEMRMSRSSSDEYISGPIRVLDGCTDPEGIYVTTKGGNVGIEMWPSPLELSKTAARALAAELLKAAGR